LNKQQQKLTFRPNKPQNSHVHSQMLQLLVTEITTDHTEGIWVQWNADEVSIQESP
jgi:hypothetical protein